MHVSRRPGDLTLGRADFQANVFIILGVMRYSLSNVRIIPSIYTKDKFKQEKVELRVMVFP